MVVVDNNTPAWMLEFTEYMHDDNEDKKMCLTTNGYKKLNENYCLDCIMYNRIKKQCSLQKDKLQEVDGHDMCKSFLHKFGV
jgi:hypothetical protein